MTKGTPSMGKKSKGKTHIRCRRCGMHSYHASDKTCAHCGFGESSKLRNYKWMTKTVTRKRKPRR